MKKDVNFRALIVLMTITMFSSSLVTLAENETSSSEIGNSSTVNKNQSDFSTTNESSSLESSETVESDSQNVFVTSDSTQVTENTLSSTDEAEVSESIDINNLQRTTTENQYGKFVSITNKNYSIYSDFSWNQVAHSKDLYGQTFEAREKYVHKNNLVYLLLFDGQGKEIGLINENATKVANGKQGIYQTYGKYVTVTNDGYSTYSNFSWIKRNATKDMYGKTYHARGKYQHVNGLTYLSLFDDGGNWYGYVNEKAVRVADGRQGIYQTYGKYVTVTNSGYSTYSNFSWTKRNSTKNMHGKTYHARGKYQHINGLTYLSLFDSSGNWYGYVNQNAVSVGAGKQGVYQSFNQFIIIQSKNYDMWQDFNWNRRKSSSTIYKQGLIAKGKYVHYNGSVYYSVYDAMGGWHGYINATGASVVTYQNNPTTYYSQMSIGAYNGCAATALYTAFQAKGYAKNVSLVSFINGLPLSDNDPDEGQIGDPWGNTVFRRVISPIGLTKYARNYTNNTEIITGSSTDRVITEINSGNLVLFWGMYLMKDPFIKEQPQHVMVAKGYKVVNGKEYILIQDSGLYSSSSPLAIRWYEKTAFDSYLTNKYRKMMVVR